MDLLVVATIEVEVVVTELDFVCGSVMVMEIVQHVPFADGGLWS